MPKEKFGYSYNEKCKSCLNIISLWFCHKTILLDISHYMKTRTSILSLIQMTFCQHIYFCILDFFFVFVLFFMSLDSVWIYCFKCLLYSYYIYVFTSRKYKKKSPFIFQSNIYMWMKKEIWKKKKYILTEKNKKYYFEILFKRYVSILLLVSRIWFIRRIYVSIVLLVLLFNSIIIFCHSHTQNTFFFAENVIR